MDGAAACVLALVIGALAILAFLVDAIPANIRERKCQGAAWRRAFPDAPKQAVREFLSMFVDAFAFRKSERLKFSPEDKIIDIYRSVYPKRWLPDALELETFAADLEKRFGFRLESVWSDQLTLGDVFRAVGAHHCAI
jgi:propanediol dehydratase small subunit